MAAQLLTQPPLASPLSTGQGNLAGSLLASYDYIIVGGGSAGCVVARRLLDNTAATVLVLEAGSADTDSASIINPVQWFQNLDSSLDYRYVNEPSPLTNNRVIGAARGKVLGGSGSINALVWSRGNRADYDAWAAAGNPGWGYEAVLPLFKKIEDWEGGETDFHGTGGPIGVATARNLHPVSAAFIEASQSFGMPYLADTNGPNPLGVGPMSTNTRNGVRSSPFERYLRPVLGHPNLTVLTAAQVVRLTMDGARCTGLEFVQGDQLYTVAAASEVILAAGAFDTPRLLLLSGVGPAPELARLGIPLRVDLPGVGQNLQDHPLIMGLCFEAKEPLGSPNENLIASAFYWKSQPSQPTADLMAIPFQVPVVLPPLAATHPAPENGFNIAPALIKVKSRGYVRMKTASHDGPLEIQPNFLADPADLEALTNAVEMCMDIAQQPAFQRLIKRWVTPTQVINRTAIQEFLRNTCISYWHPVGTCAMGSGPAAVVNNTLQVHGVEGLRIVDASVMPHIPAGNTQAPTLMIAEAAAAFIIGGK